jgi:hypothetical protein
MMMLRKMPVLLLSLVLFYPPVGHADSEAPSNYDECIIDAMKGVSSDVAARAIMESCRNLYPDAPAPAASAAAAVEDVKPAAAAPPKPAAPVAVPAAAAPPDAANARALTPEELGKLGSRAKMFGSTYRITIENGNPDITLTNVTIAVWDEGDTAAGRQEYSAAVQIAPQASAEVKYIVHYRGAETGWRWGIVAARGVD